MTWTGAVGRRRAPRTAPQRRMRKAHAALADRFLWRDRQFVLLLGCSKPGAICAREHLTPRRVYEPCDQRVAGYALVFVAAVGCVCSLVSAAVGVVHWCRRARSRMLIAGRWRLNGSSDLERPCTFPTVLWMNAVGQTATVSDDGVASRAVVTAHVENKGVSAWTHHDLIVAEVAAPGQCFKVCRTDAEPYRHRRMPAMNLLDHRIDVRTDGREERE